MKGNSSRVWYSKFSLSEGFGVHKMYTRAVMHVLMLARDNVHHTLYNEIEESYSKLSFFAAL